MVRVVEGEIRHVTTCDKIAVNGVERGAIFGRTLFFKYTVLRNGART
jgi:hypothetical protein